VLNQFPWDSKYLGDPFWYDSLGRSLVEQKKVFTVPRSGEEQVAMVKELLDDCEFQVDLNDDVESSDGGDGGEHKTKEEAKQERRNEEDSKRVQSVALEAAMKGSAAVMSYLIKERGLRADRTLDQLCLELHIAAREGYNDVLEVLIDQAGASIEAEESGATALYQAVAAGQVPTAQWLLQRGALYAPLDSNPGYIFGAAAVSGNIEVMEVLFSFAEKKEPEMATSTWTSGRAIAHAARSGSAEMMKLVMGKGGYGKGAENTRSQHEDAVVAIAMAIRNDKTDPTCLGLAIDAAFAKDENQNFVRSEEPFVIEQLSTAVANCCARAKSEDMKSMLQLVLDATTLTIDSEGFKKMLTGSLHWCYLPRSRECAQELLENWAVSPNVFDPNENLAPYSLCLIHGGVDCRDVEYAKFWLDHGADIHLARGQYCNGPTALARAIEIQAEEIVRLLLEYGGPVAKIESGLSGSKEIKATISADELQRVEILSSDANLGGRTHVSLHFDDGVPEAWLSKIQMRQSDAELVKDGSGRPLKNLE